MSGFPAINVEAGGRPTFHGLNPADGIAGLATAVAILYGRAINTALILSPQRARFGSLL